MQPITESKKPRNWTRRRINVELKARGLRQADLVPQTGRSQPMVSEVVGGNRKSLPVAEVIAAVLGTTPDVIWPRLYAPATPAPLPGDDHRTVCVDRRGGGRRCNGERRNCRRRAGHPGRCSPVAPSAPAPTPAT